MNIQSPRSARRPGGNTLVMVLIITGTSLALVAGILSRARTNSDLLARHNQYDRCLIAAEAATEKVIAIVGNEYQNQGVALVNANLSTYRTTVPLASEDSAWAGFEFMDEAGTVGRTTVDWLPVTTNSTLSLKYQGLRGFAYDVRVASRVRETGSRFNVVAQNEQNLELAVVPVFQYAIFYNLDLEINPGPPMNLWGPVHCNANIYCAPYNSLDFWDQVTAAGKIVLGKKPGDPHTTGHGTVTFHSSKKENVQSLNLPLGTNNSPAAVHQIIDVPPAGESRASLMGQLRYYNQADMVVIVSNTSVRVTSGGFNDFATSVPWSQAGSFINTNVSFYDDREDKTVLSTDINVDKLRQWSATNTLLRPLLAEQEVRSIYVANYRAASGKMAAVRLTNGAWLPAKGLTVATFNPIYIAGHYNVTTNGTPVNLNTPNTSQTRPASVAADAVTLLSSGWKDSKSTLSRDNRNASPTTMNVAILAGHSPTTSAAYGGGVHNLTRFLEDWTGDTLQLNTAIVSMFAAQSVTGLWSLSYYQPPNRNWSFDTNFNDLVKLPPLTPQVRLMVRGDWHD